MKKIMRYFFVLAIMAVLTTVVAFAGEYTDLNGTDYQKYATELSNRGIVSGYPDGEFKPNNNITRAEFAKMISKLGGTTEIAKSKSGFTDMDGYSWALEYINYCAEKGIMKGDGNGNAMPSKKISYGEAVTMIVRTLGYEKEVDMTNSSWPQNYISVAEKHNLLLNLPSYTAEKVLTRGDVITVLYNTVNINIKEKVQTSTNSAVTTDNKIDNTVINKDDKTTQKTADESTNKDSKVSKEEKKVDEKTTNKYAVVSEIEKVTDKSGTDKYNVWGFSDGCKLDTFAKDKSVFKDWNAPKGNGSNWDLYEIEITSNEMIVSAKKIKADVSKSLVQKANHRENVTIGDKIYEISENAIIYQITDDDEYKIYRGNIKDGDEVQLYELGGKDGYDIVFFTRP